MPMIPEVIGGPPVKRYRCCWRKRQLLIAGVADFYLHEFNLIFIGWHEISYFTFKLKLFILPGDLVPQAACLQANCFIFLV